MKTIDILAYKVESFDSDCFKRDTIQYNKNSIVLFFNFRKIWCAYKPPGCGISDEIMHFSRLKNARLNYCLYPALFLIDHARIFFIFLYLCLRYRIKIALVENTYVAALTAVLRVCRIVKKLLYFSGDWLVQDKVLRGGFSYLGCNVVFPLFDYAACRAADITLNCTQNIALARRSFWGRNISKKELIFQNRLEIKSHPRNPRNSRNIAFIGNVRPDSGLEMVVKALPELTQAQPALKIIGYRNKECESLQRLARHLNVGERVICTGFLERESFRDAVADCFCGINLLIQSGSYSSYTLPSKLIDYIQFLLPVIITEQVGYMAQVVRDNKLGLVIKPHREELISAVKIIFREQEAYKSNIIQYIRSFKGTDIGEYLTL